jgi:hypothetical protein
MALSPMDRVQQRYPVRGCCCGPGVTLALCTYSAGCGLGGSNEPSIERESSRLTQALCEARKLTCNGECRRLSDGEPGGDEAAEGER